MKNQVLIAENSKTGELIKMRTVTNSKTGEKREVASIMVQQTSLAGLSTFGRLQKRTAYVTLEMDAFEFIEDHIVNGAVFPVPGKIVIEESLTPYVRKDGSKQEPKINPDTGEIITYQGQPVYRNTRFTEDLNAQDVLLRDNGSNQQSSEKLPE